MKCYEFRFYTSMWTLPSYIEYVVNQILLACPERKEARLTEAAWRKKGE
ncbi:MAG: hypothetical protein H7339_02360 [Arcicella sp.]|nr:hypothetical protein [Arcicella sp.]